MYRFCHSNLPCLSRFLSRRPAGAGRICCARLAVFACAARDVLSWSLATECNSRIDDVLSCCISLRALWSTSGSPDRRADHFRQNARVTNTRSGKISRRPRIIAIAQTQLWKSVRLA
jgi:hypothetical protein